LRYEHTKLVTNDTDFIEAPSLYINGQLLKKEYSLDGLSKAVEGELTKKKVFNNGKS
jgi:hypothetical protein